MKRKSNYTVQSQKCQEGSRCPRDKKTVLRLKINAVKISGTSFSVHMCVACGWIWRLMDDLETDVEVSKCPFGVWAPRAFCDWWYGYLALMYTSCFFILLLLTMRTDPMSLTVIPSVIPECCCVTQFHLVAPVTWQSSIMTKYLCLCGSIKY